MKIETIPVFGDNYAYLVICEDTGQAAAVDPADENEVAEVVERAGLSLVAIWNTHHHMDHTAGNEGLCRHTPLRVVGHSSDKTRIPGLTDVVDDGDRLALGRLEAKVLHTPGHTRGSICYLVQDALFTGDTLFGAGCGRLFEGDAPTMYRSLHETLLPLPSKTRIFFGHEYTATNLRFAKGIESGNMALQQRLLDTKDGLISTPSTIQLERETNPFFRCSSEEIQSSIKKRFPADSKEPLQVFTRLRELRNKH